VRADHHVGLDVKLLRCRTFDQALERCCRSCVALKDGIPALQKCLHASHAEAGQELSQIGHTDLVVRPEIHRSQQCDVGGHRYASTAVYRWDDTQPPSQERRT
jgi:hypothetical protein